MNPTGKGGFKDHPEIINRKGTKMRDFASFRAAAIKVANEEIEAKTSDGKKIKMPVYEAILRTWAQSKDPRLQMAFVAYAVGNVPNVINGDQEGGPIKIETIEVVLPPEDLPGDGE